MTKTEELLKLTEAATPGPWRFTANGVIGSDAMPDEQFIVLWDDDARNRFNDFPLIAAANPATIRQLVALVRLQHEALIEAKSVMDSEFGKVPDSIQDQALAAFDAFEKGEG